MTFTHRLLNWNIFQFKTPVHQLFLTRGHFSTVCILACKWQALPQVFATKSLCHTSSKPTKRQNAESCKFQRLQLKLKNNVLVINQIYFLLVPQQNPHWNFYGFDAGEGPALNLFTLTNMPNQCQTGALNSWKNVFHPPLQTKMVLKRCGKFQKIRNMQHCWQATKKFSSFFKHFHIFCGLLSQHFQNRYKISVKSYKNKYI